MNKFLLTACLTLAATATATPESLSFEKGGTYLQIAHIDAVRPTALTIGCGKGAIVIHAENGRVEFVDCNPDEATRAVWASISNAWPFFRDVVIQSYEAGRKARESTLKVVWQPPAKGEGLEHGYREDGVVIWRKKAGD